MSSGAIQGQWAFDATVASAFSLIKGFITAANHDNVPAFSLYACEKFGNTLAISAHTIQKVRTTIVPTPPPATVAFLSASVGFSKDDCATQLGSTAPGVRFLGLAAALVTSTGSLHGAKAIRMMMQSSKAIGNPEDSTPSDGQIDGILKVLAARSLRCGFQDMMVTWGVLLRQTVFPRLFQAREQTRPMPESPQRWDSKSAILNAVPSPEAIAAIVDAFRQVARLGDASVVGVTIKVTAGAAWILAFAQWCLDIPPSLFVDERNILEPPGSLIKVVIPKGQITGQSNKPMEITLHHQIPSLSTLFESVNQYSSHGMINLESYQKWLLLEFGFDSRSGRRLLNQVFEYAVPQILPNMSSGKFGRLGRNSRFVVNFTASDPLDSYRAYLLPDIRIISDLCRLILGEDSAQKFTMLREGFLIEDLPLVKLEQDRLRLICNCMDCIQKESKGPGAKPQSKVCVCDGLLKDISTIIMNIFALSLFEGAEFIMVRPTHARYRGHDMRNAIHNILKTGKPQLYSDGDLIDWARSMVGHDFDDEERSLLVTSTRGQVLYPSIFEAYYFERIGYIRLISHDGVLKYDGDTFDVVACSDDDLRTSDASVSSDQSEVLDGSEQTDTYLSGGQGLLQPTNSYKSSNVSWDIVTREGRNIEAKLMIRWQVNNFRANINPEMAIWALPDTLIYEGCQHESRERLLGADTFSTTHPPWRKISSGSKSWVSIVPVAGSDSLRFFALAHNNMGAILRRHACLRCCLALCRENDVRCLVL